MAAKQKKRKNFGSNDPANFKLPDSLTCSDIEFPIVMRAKQKASWKDIVLESEKFQEDLKQITDVEIDQRPFLHIEADFIVNQVFGLLLPAIEETLRKAKIWNVLTTQKSFFNGIDHIAQYLWNNNPRHPIRKIDNHHIFNMPWVRKHLKEQPRQLYPKSWLWPEEYATQTIQSYLRGYFVRRAPEVVEMRSFWKKIRFEEKNPVLKENYTLSKRFALCDVNEVCTT